MNQFLLVVLYLCTFGNCIYAQQLPKTCAESQSLLVTPSEIQGEWFAWAYQTDNGISCVDVDIAMADQTWTINVTYSQQPNPLYMNQTITTNFTVMQAQNSGNGLNLTFQSTTTNQTVKAPAVYKILYIDPNNNYALVCQYTNETDNASSYGVILGRQRMVNSTYLDSVESDASASFSNFLNGTMYQVPQNMSCYTNSASTFTMTTLLMAIFYFAIKLL